MGGDFFTRLSQLFSHTDPVLLVTALLCASAIVLMGVSGGRRWLLLLLLLSFVFAGVAWTGVAAAATMMRWLTLAMLAVNVLRVQSFPGWAWACFCGYVVAGILFVGFSEALVFSIQASVVLIIVALAAAALAGYVTAVDKASRIFTMFIIAGAVWAALGLSGITSIMEFRLWAERYAGVGENAAIFSHTGAIFLPFAVWGAMRPWSWNRRALCTVLAAAILLCLVVSAQRAGALAGIIGCLPLLFLRNYRATLAGGAVLSVGLAVTYLVLSFSPQQLEYITRRYTEDGLNSRDIVWANALRACLQNPLIGAGHGGSETMVQLSGDEAAYTRHGAHNGFLAAWYNTGIFGLLLVVGAVAIAVWQAFRIARHGASDEIRQIGCLLLGALLCVLALSMVTDGFARPSGSTTVMLVLVIALIGQVATMSQQLPAAGLQYWLVPVSYRPSAATTT